MATLDKTWPEIRKIASGSISRMISRDGGINVKKARDRLNVKIQTATKKNWTWDSVTGYLYPDSNAFPKLLVSAEAAYHAKQSAMNATLLEDKDRCKTSEEALPVAEAAADPPSRPSDARREEALRLSRINAKKRPPSDLSKAMAGEASFEEEEEAKVV